MTTGSAASFGYQSDREVLAEKILEMRRKLLGNQSVRRGIASDSKNVTQMNAFQDQSQDRLTLREMDMVVELKIMKKMIFSIQDRLK